MVSAKFTDQMLKMLPSWHGQEGSRERSRNEVGTASALLESLVISTLFIDTNFLEGVDEEDADAEETEMHADELSALTTAPSPIVRSPTRSSNITCTSTNNYTRPTAWTASLPVRRPPRKRPQYQEGRVAPAEVFSDMVVSVAIHSLVAPLTSTTSSIYTSNNYDSLSHFRTSTMWPTCFLRVFFTWYLWHSELMVHNTGMLFEIDPDPANPDDLSQRRSNVHRTFFAHTLHTHGYRFAVIVFFMMFKLLFVEACQRNDDLLAAVLIIIGRVIAIAVLIGQCYCLPRPDWIGEMRYRYLRRVAIRAPLHIIFELLPLAAAVCLTGSRTIMNMNMTEGQEQTGQDQERDAKVLLWGGALTCAFFFVFRTVGAILYDLLGSYKGILGDIQHFQNRYGNITSVFFGLLCFAPASSSKYSNYSGTLSSLATTIACFILYFADRVPGRTEHWRVDTLPAHSLFQVQHLHVVLFCAIQGMGVAYARILQTDGMNYAATGSQSGYLNPDTILLVSGGTYLITMGLMEVFSRDPSGPGVAGPKMPMKARVGTQIIVGTTMTIAAIGRPEMLMNHGMIIVPAVLNSVALVLLWGVGLNI